MKIRTEYRLTELELKDLVRAHFHEKTDKYFPIDDIKFDIIPKGIVTRDENPYRLEAYATR